MTSSAEVSRSGALEPDRSYDSMVEGSLSWSALSADDLPELAELKTAIDYFDQPFDVVDYADIERRWHDQAQQAVKNAVVGRDRAGTIVAFAWNRCDFSDPDRAVIWLDGGVHPALRHQDLERRRLAWQLERAAAWLHEPGRERYTEVVCRRHIKASNERFRATAESVGLRARRWYADLIVDLKNNDHDYLVDIGQLTVEPLRRGEIDNVDAARLAHNLAFATRPGTHPMSLTEWLAVLDEPDCRPEWSWVAKDGDHVVGYVVNSVTDNDDGELGGWTSMLGVIPQYRKRSIALSLLHASMSSFREADCLWAGIGVDTENPESALKGYGKIGYLPETQIVLYSRTISRYTPLPLGLFE